MKKIIWKMVLNIVEMSCKAGSRLKVEYAPLLYGVRHCKEERHLKSVLTLTV